MRPEVRYATHEGASIAWAQVGDGPLELVFLSGLLSHVEQVWEDPGFASFLGRLTRFARVLLVDRRGCGLSDRITSPTDLDTETGDVLAVLDAAGAERPVLLGYTTGGALALHVAAAHPERVRALVLYAPFLSSVADPDYPHTHDAAERAAMVERRVASWGTGALLEIIAPSLANDRAARDWLARMERLSSSPTAVRAVLDQRIDVRQDLAQVRAPTLVLHRRGDRLIDVAHGRWAAAHLPGARYVELEGDDDLPSAGDTGALLGEIEEFLTGSRGLTRERELLTVLFTDLVGSTGHAQRLGDERWAALLTAQDTSVRRAVERNGGRAVKSIGDSVLAVFAGAPSRAVVAALEARDRTLELGLELRAGLHTGECEVLGEDVGGMAVHIAARVSALAQPGEVLASGTTFGTVVGAGLPFEDRGTVELRGVSGRWPVFALAERRSPTPTGPAASPSRPHRRRGDPPAP